VIRSLFVGHAESIWMERARWSARWFGLGLGLGVLVDLIVRLAVG
jgi:hypothetical protein